MMTSPLAQAELVFTTNVKTNFETLAKVFKQPQQRLIRSEEKL